MGVRRRHLLFMARVVVGGVVVVVLVGDTTAGLVGRVGTTGARGDPMNSDGVKGHIQGTREKAEDGVFVTAIVDKSEHISGTENQGDDGADQSAASNLTQLALAGTLKDRGGAHQWANEQDGEPAGHKDIIENQDDGGQGLETNDTLVLVVEDGNTVENHENQDDGVWGEQQDIDAVEKSVLAGGGDGANDIDLLNEEEVDDNLGGSVEGEADKDGQGARCHVAGVGGCQDCSYGCEPPRYHVERDDEASGVVDAGHVGT